MEPWTPEVARVYADLRVACETAGVTLAPLDLMIAAHAMALGATLVTQDQVFGRVPGGLSLEDWTETRSQ
jgi:tRNA(fMet)-specific endonuclease VapC